MKSPEFRITVTILLIVLAFLVGLFIGETRVLDNQKVTGNQESGYSVYFEGHEYKYY